ncbi:hypothetical protein DFJ74DRAFT_666607 [Hyaloraphidium curvatum]|nr:hypothetical protein DFJ74DRAFT_666607 [Hyaloraphidium curvatum]
MYCQYGGRGVQQLSYNFNYAPCSLELFGDYRLVRYPNLIITVDRKSFMGQPGTFGFPGPNPGGNNQIPANIASTTPPARQMAWITSLWFYMRATSSRSITCHQAMMDPFRYGITAANVVVNSQSGCESNSWASAKNAYYRRVCGILGVDAGVIERTIVCPAAIQ